MYFIAELPEIKKDPEDVTVDFGDNAIFTCLATGDPTPDIVWFRDSEPLPVNAPRYEIIDNGTLMVHGIDEKDVGIFECMAKNPNGEVMSKPARMTLQPKASKYHRRQGTRHFITDVPIICIFLTIFFLQTPMNHILQFCLNTN